MKYFLIITLLIILGGFFILGIIWEEDNFDKLYEKKYNKMYCNIPMAITLIDLLITGILIGILLKN